MLHRRKNGKKREEGQAMLEFVLVLPVFLLLISIIFDYGWLFYNYIGMENAGRNAARVACVEYDDVCLATGGAYYSNAVGTFEYDKDAGTWSNMSPSDNSDGITEEEEHILREVKNTIPPTLNDIKVQMKYTYDEDFIDGKYSGTYYAADRHKGDVVILVTATHRAISPFVAVGEAQGAGKMKRKISSKSVYKVEKSEDTLSGDDGA